MIQKALDRVGFSDKVGTKISEMSLFLDNGAGPRVNFKFKREDFRDAYKWQQAFNDTYIKSVRARFTDVPIWHSLKALLHPAKWCADTLPLEDLRVLAEFHEKDHGSLSNEWLELKPLVKGRLGAVPLGCDQLCEHFRMSYLLPALFEHKTSQAPGTENSLTRLLTLGILTVNNCAQLERDMESVGDIWHVRAKTLPLEMIEAQCMLHLNSDHRDIDEFLASSFIILSDSELRQQDQKFESECNTDPPRKKQRCECEAVLESDCGSS